MSRGEATAHMRNDTVASGNWKEEGKVVGGRVIRVGEWLEDSLDFVVVGASL